VSVSSSLLDVLDLHGPSALDVLTRGLGREVRRTGFERVVLGLSGGLDSALTAALAARTFGPGHVLALAMPYRTSNPDSLGHARLVAEALGIELRVSDISPQIDAYFDTAPQAGAARRGNKMARERMTILYDVSMAETAMVLGTSNKTELLLGYSTIWGDSASAVNPIGDLYKTQVRQLARFLDLPREVIDKAPSADLWEGQTDEGELGFTYEQVDTLLAHLVDRRQRPAQLRKLGFAADFVERVRSLMVRSQFKRKMPVIVKISGRTVDKDFLYPRDWTG
jgi:NAD+ synthase